MEKSRQTARAVTPAARSGPRRAVLIGLALATPLLLYLSARRALASAVARAPNAGQLHASPGTLPIPEALRARHAVRLETRGDSESVTLESWLVDPAEGARKGTIVLLHGVRMDKRSLVPVATALVDAGYRTVLVDLRGHGESSGRYLTYGADEASDISAMLDVLSTRSALGCVGVYGFSYGGAVAVELGARDRRVTATVAVAPFASLREVIADYKRKYLPEPLSLIPDAWFQSVVTEAGHIATFDPDQSSPLHAATRSHGKLLLIHGSADTQVPPRHSQLLLGAGNRDTRLVIVPGAVHESMPSDPDGTVRRETIAWFDRWFARAGCQRE